MNVKEEYKKFSLYRNVHVNICDIRYKIITFINTIFTINQFFWSILIDKINILKNI